jgi:hypothetical protein
MSEKQALVALTTITIAPSEVPPGDFFGSAAAAMYGDTVSKNPESVAAVTVLNMSRLNHVWTAKAINNQRPARAGRWLVCARSQSADQLPATLLVAMLTICTRRFSPPVGAAGFFSLVLP